MADLILSKLDVLIEHLTEIRDELAEEGKDTSCEVIVSTHFDSHVQPCKILNICRDSRKNKEEVAIYIADANESDFDFIREEKEAKRQRWLNRYKK